MNLAMMEPAKLLKGEEMKGDANLELVTADLVLYKLRNIMLDDCDYNSQDHKLRYEGRFQV